MIYIKEGTGKLEGSHAQLLTDLTCVIKELKDSLENDLSKENAEKMIREAVDASIEAGIVTEDLAQNGKSYKTSEVGQWIADYIKNK